MREEVVGEVLPGVHGDQGLEEGQGRDGHQGCVARYVVPKLPPE